MHIDEEVQTPGITAGRIRIETVKNGWQAGKTRLDFAQNRNYGTVIIGRCCINKFFFMGGVARFLINRVADQALWMVS